MEAAMPGEWRSGPVRYPDPAIEVVAPAFQRYGLGNAAVERIHTGSRWTEGPVWFGDGRYLLWSDIPNNRILRWCEESGSVSVYRSPCSSCPRTCTGSIPRPARPRWWPEVASNLCFGGLRRNRLFITAGQSVYAVYLETQGMPFP